MRNSDAVPDLVLHRGLVTTLDRSRPTATAVAIKQGVFSAVGEDREVLPLAGKGAFNLFELRFNKGQCLATHSPILSIARRTREALSSESKLRNRKWAPSKKVSKVVSEPPRINAISSSL